MAIVPLHIKRNVDSLLSSKVDGVYLSEFLSDYYNLHHEPLKFRDLGFSSLYNFLISIPDVARIMTIEDSESKVFGVAAKASYRSLSPEEIHSRHYDNSINTAKMNIMTNGHGDASAKQDIFLHTKNVEDDGLKPDPTGWWSVCFHVNKCPTDNIEALRTLFNQAGEVQQIRFTDKVVFVRYAVKEEAILATKLFSHLHVSIAKVHKATKNLKPFHKHQLNSSLKDNQARARVDRRTNEEIFEIQQSTNFKSSGSPDVSSSVTDRNHNFCGSIPVLENAFGKLNIPEKVDGQKSKQELQRKLLSLRCHQQKLANGEMKPLSPSSETNSVHSAHTLFVRNIECEELLKEMIKPYNPVSFRVRQSKGRLIAFLEMSSEKKAQEAIHGLNNRLQKTLCLKVYKHENRIENGSASGKNPLGSSAAEPVIVEAHETPNLQVTFPGISPSKHETEQELEENFHHLDCRIIVANFHPKILASELQYAFEKYHLVDFCLLNNGIGPGNTKAILYLQSISDVIGAIRDMRQSVVIGGPLQVDVPEENIIEKAFIDKKLATFKAASFQHFPSTNRPT